VRETTKLFESLKLDVRAKGHVLEFVRPFLLFASPCVLSCPSITASSADRLPCGLLIGPLREPVPYPAMYPGLSYSEEPSITVNKKPMVFLAGWELRNSKSKNAFTGRELSSKRGDCLGHDVWAWPELHRVWRMPEAVKASKDSREVY
jgi:hypothetical protein